MQPITHESGELQINIDFECEKEWSTVAESQQQGEPARTKGREQIGAKWKDWLTSELLPLR
jgi:hypothetical protein